MISSTISSHQGIIDTVNTSTYVIAQQTGISKASVSKLNLSIFPNPAHDFAQISLTLTDKSNVDVTILDITGRIVYTALHNNLPAGDNQLSIATSDLHSGIYMVRVTAGDNSAASKLVIQ